MLWRSLKRCSQSQCDRLRAKEAAGEMAPWWLSTAKPQHQVVCCHWGGGSCRVVFRPERERRLWVQHIRANAPAASPLPRHAMGPASHSSVVAAKAAASISDLPLQTSENHLGPRGSWDLLRHTFSKAVNEAPLSKLKGWGGVFPTLSLREGSLLAAWQRICQL